MQRNFNSLEDFLEDKSFRNWAFNENEADIVFWNSWISENPDKADMVETAAAFFRLLRQGESLPGVDQVKHASERLQAALEAQKTVRFRFSYKIWGRIAASVLAILSLGLVFKYLIQNGQPYEKVATNYGQISQHILPDSSEVMLNANSNLKYKNNWKDAGKREVWVEGEAFFHVRKTATRSKFIVHTDAFDIEVTGTSFDVTNKAGKSSIILKEGSVKIHRPGQPDIAMVPGDFIVWSNNKIQKETVGKNDYLAWTENKLVFEKTPLAKVAEKIREHYGVEVKIEGTGAAEKLITGIMPNNNLTVLLQALEATQEYTITKNNREITITTKN